MGKPRKAYRPKPARIPGVLVSMAIKAGEALALERADAENPPPEAKREQLMATLRSALLSISRGTHPGEEDWRQLSDAINCVETMECMGIADPAETTEIMTEAMKGMVEAAQRFRDGKGMRMSGPGLQAVNQVLDIYEQALCELDERTVILITQETARRMHRAMYGERVSDRKVVAL